MIYFNKLKLITVFLFTVSYLCAQTAVSYKFDFGSGKGEEGFTRVLSSMVYSNEKGYGFDYGTVPVDVKRKGKDALSSDFVTSEKPFYFSVAVPEGNYRVKVTMGDLNGESVNMIRAESRRLFVENCKTAKGEIISRSFTVNVRTPRINDSLSIKIKPREKGYLNWDNKLTLEFTGSKPCICSVEITKVDDVITVFLAGNSTVTDQDREPWASWGQMIPRFFTSDVCVANYAESGESLSSFRKAGRLQKILYTMKPGDYLFIEFGHNDQKQKGEGIGPWTSYKSDLKKFVALVREKGGIPVLVTSMHRRSFDSIGNVVNTLGDYPAAVRKVAEEDKVALIDLNKMSKVLYEAWGPEKSVKGFVHYPANSFPGQDKALADNTHFNTYGAYEIAKCILEGIKANNLDLEEHIADDFQEFNPAIPDSVESWIWPLSPMVSNEKPDGN
jgi:lysophospholipase L1-like esterase